MVRNLLERMRTCIDFGILCVDFVIGEIECRIVG